MQPAVDNKLVESKVSEILEKMKILNDREYLVLKLDVSDARYEAYIFALLKLFSLENSEEVIPITEAKPFDVQKRKIDNRICYLLSNSLDDVHIILRDDEGDIERKLLDAELEFFDKIKELLKLNDCQFAQIIDEDNQVTIYFLASGGVESGIKLIDFHGDKLRVKIGRRGIYIYVGVGYKDFFKIYYSALDGYKKVNL